MLDHVLVCEPGGQRLRTDRDALDLIGEAMGRHARWVAVPAERLHDDFWRLSTRVAGEIVQKFATYRLGLAIVGDVSEHVAASESFRAWVLEADRGRQTWFVADLEELERRLSAGEGAAGHVDEGAGDGGGVVGGQERGRGRDLRQRG
ncbi:DUF4180 domain-containing protein [Nonomuraea sp. NPDC000554]|uniref:DUF4180 domain-containing protein n=1 Tax=Nonomuraea sp. NPDC000554 TaxID=3154259 RepID=UPI0033248701